MLSSEARDRPRRGPVIRCTGPMESFREKNPGLNIRANWLHSLGLLSGPPMFSLPKEDWNGCSLQSQRTLWAESGAGLWSLEQENLAAVADYPPVVQILSDQIVRARTLELIALIHLLLPCGLKYVT